MSLIAPLFLCILYSIKLSLYINSRVPGNLLFFRPTFWVTLCASKLILKYLDFYDSKNIFKIPIKNFRSFTIFWTLENPFVKICFLNFTVILWHSKDKRVKMRKVYLFPILQLFDFWCTYVHLKTLLHLME